MTKFYQIMNFQHQSVKVCKDQSEAERHIVSLRETYDEGFYVVELQVVYSIRDIR